MNDKQKSCIEWICETLGVTYYGKDNVKDASNFIGKFIERAKEVQRERNFYNNWGMSYFLNRPFR